MKVLKNGRGLRKLKSPVLTLGNFDGLHLGHRRILKKISERAGRLKCPSAVYTFEPHPLKVIAPHKSPPLISDAEDKAKIIGEIGIDYLIFARFTKEFASKHPRQFVEEELSPMSVREVWVGHDFSFGKGRSGTVESLRELGREFGFKVFMIPAYRKGGAIVSSSRIRGLVREGDVRRASKLLGREFFIKGRVVKGKSIGKGIGFPTANIRAEGELIPGDGVYAAYALFEGGRFPSVVNIGTAPTFGGKKRTIEVHILGFKGDIYGKRLEVLFKKRLRGEKEFPSKEALVRQIKKDVERAGKAL